MISGEEAKRIGQMCDRAHRRAEHEHKTRKAARAEMREAIAQTEAQIKSVKQRPSTPSQRRDAAKQYADMVKGGEPRQSAAIKLDLPIDLLRVWCRRYNVKVISSRIAESEVDRLIDLVNVSGIRYMEACAIVGRSETRLRQRLSLRGLRHDRYRGLISEIEK